MNIKKARMQSGKPLQVNSYKAYYSPDSHQVYEIAFQNNRWEIDPYYNRKGWGDTLAEAVAIIDEWHNQR